MFDRILVSDFVWGFRDLEYHFKEWFRLIRYGANDPNCPQTRQWEHDFFNNMTCAVSRYCHYYIEYEKYV